jgi:hypothetical protein
MAVAEIVASDGMRRLGAASNRSTEPDAARRNRYNRLNRTAYVGNRDTKRSGIF